MNITGNETEGKMQKMMPRCFDLFNPERIEQGLAFTDEIFLSNPSNLTLPGVWGNSAGGITYNFNGSTKGTPIDWTNSYISMSACPSSTINTFTAYTNNTRVALTPNLSGNLSSESQVLISSQPWENIQNYSYIGNFYDRLINTSGSYQRSQLGYDDDFILDSAGPTVGQTQLMNNLIFNGASGSTYELCINVTGAAATNVLGLRVLTGAGAGSDAITSIQYYVANEDPFLVTLRDTTTNTVSAISFETGSLVSAAAGYNIILNYTGTTTTADNITLFANGSAIQFCYLDTIGAQIAVAIQAKAGAASTCALTLTPYNGITVGVAGDCVYGNFTAMTTGATALGYWKRLK